MPNMSVARREACTVQAIDLSSAATGAFCITVRNDAALIPAKLPQRFGRTREPVAPFAIQFNVAGAYTK
jgi:hypothetical protein